MSDEKSECNPFSFRHAVILFAMATIALAIAKQDGLPIGWLTVLAPLLACLVWPLFWVVVLLPGILASSMADKK